MYQQKSVWADPSIKDEFDTEWPGLASASTYD